MTIITVLKVRGLGENMQTNMLSGVTRQLDPKKFRVVEVPYSATFGPIGSPDIMASSLAASVDEAVTNMNRLTAEAPGPVVGVGYSFGTLCINEWIARNKTNKKILLGATLADARRKPGRSYGLPCPGAGIFGTHVEDQRLWAAIAWPGDVVTALPVDSPLRKASHLLSWFSLADPVRWAAQMTTDLPQFLQEQIGPMSQHAFDMQWWQRYFEVLIKTGQMVDGYARLGEHTARYNEPHWRDWQGKPITGIDLLARVITAEGKKVS